MGYLAAIILLLFEFVVLVGLTLANESINRKRIAKEHEGRVRQAQLEQEAGPDPVVRIKQATRHLISDTLLEKVHEAKRVREERRTANILKRLRR